MLFTMIASYENLRKEHRNLKHLKFIDSHGSFLIEQPERTNYLYFPLASEAGLRTPSSGLSPGRLRRRRPRASHRKRMRVS